MAFLLLLHEKMRLQRRYNKLTLKQLRMGNLLSRVQSKIDKRQKYYARLEKNLETQATMWKNRMKAGLQQQFGCVSNSLGMGMNSLFGASGQAMQIAGRMNFANFQGTDKPFGSDTNLNSYLQQFMQCGCRAFKGSDIANDANALKNLGLSSVDKDKYYYSNGTGGNICLDATQYNALAQMKSAVDNQMYQNQSMYSMGTQSIDEQASIWLQYQRDQLDMQQEYEMDLLAEEQSDYEMEKTGIETELELIKQRKEAIQQELAEQAKDVAPKFGLA